MQTIEVPLKVRSVGTLLYKTSEYIVVSFYLPATTNDGIKAIGCIRREIHLVNNLRAKMLISNDIISPEQIIIDIANKSARIDSYYLNIKINIYQRGKYVRRTVLA